jgi:hypothetical protein
MHNIHLDYAPSYLVEQSSEPVWARDFSFGRSLMTLHTSSSVNRTSSSCNWSEGTPIWCKSMCLDLTKLVPNSPS